MTEFKVGDIVEFADRDQEQWQGGRGKLKSFDGTYWDVEILVMPPKNSGNAWSVGNVMTDKPTNLRLVQDSVEHPAHYGGDTTYEVIKVIEAWDLDFKLGNSVKYIARAGKKDPDKEIEDLEKGVFYILRRIQQLKEARGV